MRALNELTLQLAIVTNFLTKPIFLQLCKAFWDKRFTKIIK